MMWNWFSRNAQALGALFSALALLGVLYQVYASEKIQQAQSARDIYREFVALTINKPELASFQWSPNLPEKDRAAYEAYVEYLLYTSEQVISVDASWRASMQNWLEDHSAFLCGKSDLSGYTPGVEELVLEIKAQECLPK